MRRIYWLMSLLLVIFSSLISQGRKIFICDAVDMSPLPAASVTNGSGELVGLSDYDGYIDLSTRSLPLIISYQGYDKKIIKELTDTISLNSSVVSLPELVVGRDNTGVRLICLADELTTNIAGEDTIFVKARYIVDFILPFKDKPKGFKKQENARIINEQYDAVKRTKAGSEKIDAKEVFLLPAVGFVELKSGSLVLPEVITENPVSDTRIKFDGLDCNLRRRDNQLICSFDALENKKNHRISPGFAKLLGFSMDITRMEFTESFAYHPGEIDRAFDFLGASFGFDGILRGKMFKFMLGIKGDMSFQSSVELKLLDSQFITNEESRQLRKDPGSYPFPNVSL